MAGPTMPSAVRPRCCWNCRTAACVCGPKTLSTVRFAPAAIKACWTVRTSAPVIGGAVSESIRAGAAPTSAFSSIVTPRTSIGRGRSQLEFWIKERKQSMRYTVGVQRSIRIVCQPIAPHGHVMTDPVTFTDGAQRAT